MGTAYTRKCSGKADGNPEVHYLQSQNGNIYSSSFFEDVPAHDVSEFEPLRLDVPNEIPWCSEAFGEYL
jgi:jumonji domain-containing protein 7